MEAIELYRCTRLARVVNDLRNEGHQIRTQMLRNTVSGASHGLYILEDHEVSNGCPA